MLSCIIPTTKNESRYLIGLLSLLIASARRCDEPVEILVIENGEKGVTEQIVHSMASPTIHYHYLTLASRSLAKNFGASKARGRALIFIDADNICSYDLFQEVSEKASNPLFFGGGCKSLVLSRPNLGVIVYFTFLLTIFTLKAIFNPLNPFSVGIFWFKKEAFEELGGWKDVNLKELSPTLLSFIPPQYQPADDIDMGKRMKEYEKKTGLKFESLKKTIHIWNTRKFDMFGDWSWLGLCQREASK